MISPSRAVVITWIALMATTFPNVIANFLYSNVLAAV